MRVSAISANIFCPFRDKVVSGDDDKTVDTANTFTASPRTESAEKELYRLINEWRNFCHKQVLNGNTDYIA